MLILSRKVGQRIRIGDSVEITVLGIGTRRVRLAVQAPPEIAIHRHEVFNSIAEEREQEREQEGELVAHAVRGSFST